MFRFLFLAAFTAAFFLSPLPALADRAAQESFFEQLERLCGQTLTGETVFSVAGPNDDMTDAKLVLRFEKHSENEIRVPFQVDEDHSRTWIITLSEDGLLLKHDHRDPDGTPHEVTEYGGWADDSGTSDRQFFAADEHTVKLFPHADNAGWTLWLEPSKKQLVYYVENAGKLRYRAIFGDSVPTVDEG